MLWEIKLQQKTAYHRSHKYVSTKGVRYIEENKTAFYSQGSGSGEGLGIQGLMRSFIGKKPLSG